MNELLEQYIEYLQNSKKSSDNTVQSYKRDLKKFMTFLENQGISDFDAVTNTDLRSYVLQMEGEHFSASTISRNVASIRSFFLYLLTRLFIQAAAFALSSFMSVSFGFSDLNSYGFDG